MTLIHTAIAITCVFTWAVNFKDYVVITSLGAGTLWWVHDYYPARMRKG